MSDVDTTREQINKIIDGALAQIRPVIKPEGGTGIMGTLSASDFLRIDIHDLLEQAREQARNAALDDLLEAMPKKYKYRHKHDIQSENGKYMCLNCKKSPDDILGNDGTGYCPHFRSFNEAVDLATATIHQLKSSKKGADDE